MVRHSDEAFRCEMDRQQAGSYEELRLLRATQNWDIAFFMAAKGLLQKHLPDGGVFECPGQCIAHHIAHQLGIGFLIRRHARALVQ